MISPVEMMIATAALVGKVIGEAGRKPSTKAYARREIDGSEYTLLSKTRRVVEG